MGFEQQASSDFERAVSRGFWRQVLTWLTGADNSLLPFDEVRARLPMSGQHYVGLRQVETDKIVGSFGRYRDFDRVFLPLQRTTKDRWVSIGQAHYRQAPLPPVELYKIGEIYFVKDGNHRVSVARERGQVFIDAYVTEIDTPVHLSPDVSLDDLDLKRQNAEFLQQTGLKKLRPAAEIDFTVPDLIDVARSNIEEHRWYLGEEQKREVPLPEAAVSWYDQIYAPLAEQIRSHGLLEAFKGSSEADLCLWVITYQRYLYQAAGSVNIQAESQAARQVIGDYPQPAVKKLIGVMRQTGWLNEFTLAHERAHFLEESDIRDIRPEAHIKCSLPGMYYRLLEHISVHRYYLGEQRNTEIPMHEAVASWYDNVYQPLVEVIREQGILDNFPGRTETDLYLWIIRHQWHLRETYGKDIPLQAAVENFTKDYSEKPVNKFVKVFKKVTGL